MMAKNVFALKVRGESMMDAGILDGDYVVVEPCTNPKNGDIVVALIQKDNVTLKRFYREKDHIRLQPANKKFQPIRVKKVTIQGRVKGVIRKFG
jgi:repressor LexA